jgi:hypothetical protein
MIRNDWDSGRALLERVAQEYRDNGYEVIVGPIGEDLPDFIRDYRPDAIARTDKESVVIELKHSSSKSAHERIGAIAKRIENRPGWRFVLISPPPEEEADAGRNLRPLESREIEARLREANLLGQTGHHAAALLLAWATVEAVMRRVSRDQSPTGRSDTWRLMRELVSDGLLDRGRYQELTDLFRLRSAVAHGLEPPEGIRRDQLDHAVGVLTGTAEELMTELGTGQ